MSDLEGADARRRIELATLALIERDGVENLTTRALAAEAKVNLASINYYYRSKDRLVAEVVAASAAHTLGDLRAFLEAEPFDPRASLGAVADYLLEGGQAFPHITQAHFLGLATAGDPASGRSSIFRDLATEISGSLCRRLGLGQSEALDLVVAAFVASLVYPALVPAGFPSLARPGSRSLYRDQVVDSCLRGLNQL